MSSTRAQFPIKHIEDAGERMGETIEVSRDAFEPIAELVRMGLFKNENEALKDLVLERAEAKVHCFEAKISEMRSKHRMSFNDFKRRIEERQGEEAFEDWDDFIIWDSYESARAYWANVETKLLSTQR